MSDDIVTRLKWLGCQYDSSCITCEAADEIGRLRALTSELAQLMMPFALLMSAEEQQKVLKAVRGEE